MKNTNKAIIDTNNIDEKIQKLEDQRSEIDEQLSDLYSIKDNEDKTFRDSLIGKCFKFKSETYYFKVLRKNNTSLHFKTFEFNSGFIDQSKNYHNEGYDYYNCFDCNERFIQDRLYLEDYEEISNEEFLSKYDELVNSIRKEIE